MALAARAIPGQAQECCAYDEIPRVFYGAGGKGRGVQFHRPCPETPFAEGKGPRRMLAGHERRSRRPLRGLLRARAEGGLGLARKKFGFRPKCLKLTNSWKTFALNSASPGFAPVSAALWRTCA